MREHDSFLEIMYWFMVVVVTVCAALGVWNIVKYLFTEGV